MTAKHAGRGTRKWRELRRRVLSESDICVWCGHPGAQNVNHNIPRGMAPNLAEDINNLAPIHGYNRWTRIQGCPICPWRWSKRLRRMAPRDCNNEVGRRPLHVAMTQQHTGSRLW